jgi:hypothetical protein
MGCKGVGRRVLSLIYRKVDCLLYKQCYVIRDETIGVCGNLMDLNRSVGTCHQGKGQKESG